LLRLLLVILAAAAVASACDDSTSSPDPTATTSASATLPAPVDIRDEPQGIGLRDPSFEALPGATAHHGRLGGTVYQIEVPDNWNRRLVLYMHGFQGLAPEASVDPPGIRGYLVRNGYAWAASSYSSTALIPGRAADETAALWDEFVERFGRPDYTYATGHSMGGAASHITAERYGGRVDGVLGLCGFASQSDISEIIGDYFFAGAYVAGVTQTEFDTTPIDQLIANRIKPALRDPVAHERWVDIMLDMTGGARAHDRLGFAFEEETNWERAQILVGFGLSHNAGREYAPGDASGVTRGDFNDDIIRKTPADEDTLANFLEGNEITGDLQVPLLTMHTTGDWQVPIDQQQTLKRAVDAAGKSDLLVQRIVREARHCAFLDREWEQALEDLVAWVERNERPDGEDVLVDDLRAAGAKFTLAPRIGSPEADALTGADERVTVRANITLDGAPLVYAFIWAEVTDAGLRRLCAFPPAPRPDGVFEQVLASESEKAGCGAPGRRIRIAASVGDRVYFSDESVAWPAGDSVELDVNFTSEDAERPADNVTPVFGGVYDGGGERLPPGTTIEAYIGDTLCGITGIPASVMLFENPDVYDLLVAGPDAIPGCARDGVVTFKVDGVDVDHTARNVLETDIALDLTLR
jgi:pimeloyl-ACP methyl ester carboxylesterase